MKKKLSKTLLRELKAQGYTAIIGAEQLENNNILYTPSKEPYDSIIESANYTPFDEDDIIILTSETIDSIAEDFFDGKEVEID